MEWDEERARAIVHGVVERNVGLFAAFKDLEFDDLVSHALDRVREARGDFRARRGDWSAWVGGVAHRRLIDLWRSRSAELQRGKRVARAAVVQPAVVGGEEEGGDDRPLADWLRDVYVAAKVRFGARKVRGGRKWYSPAQAAACLALRHRLDLSFEALASLLAERDDLRRVLGVLRKPSVKACKRFVKKVEEFGDETSGWCPGDE